jgi:hypothetical protein
MYITSMEMHGLLQMEFECLAWVPLPLIGLCSGDSNEMAAVARGLSGPDLELHN